MKLQSATILAILALAACGSGGGDLEIGSVEGDGGGSVGIGTEEEEVDPNDTCANSYDCTGDVVAVSYDADDDILSITGTPFDETELAGTYVRAGTDVNGIPTYINDDPDRFNDYIAYLAESAGGEIQVGAIGIEGYQDFGYSGTYLLLTDSATNLPSEGLVEFTGNAAGVLVYEGAGALDTSLGFVTLEVDFTDNRLKGFVTGRNSTSTIGTLPTSLVFNDTDIQNGEFSGTVNSYNGAEVLEEGTYSGAFAGDGSVVGGTYEATYDDFAGDITSRDTGVFIATETP